MIDFQLLSDAPAHCVHVKKCLSSGVWCFCSFSVMFWDGVRTGREEKAEVFVGQTVALRCA
jgi:hypothetical protein